MNVISGASVLQLWDTVIETLFIDIGAPEIFVLNIRKC